MFTCSWTVNIREREHVFIPVNVNRRYKHFIGCLIPYYNTILRYFNANKKAQTVDNKLFAPYLFVHLKVVEPLNFSELSSVNKKPVSHRQNPFLFIWLINFALLK